MTKSLSPIRP